MELAPRVLTALGIPDDEMSSRKAATGQLQCPVPGISKQSLCGPWATPRQGGLGNSSDCEDQEIKMVNCAGRSEKMCNRVSHCVQDCRGWRLAAESQVRG